MKMSFVLGILVLSCRPASRPFSCGIVISSTMMSGFSLPAASRSARPSLTVPTTSQRGSRTFFSASPASDGHPPTVPVDES